MASPRISTKQRRDNRGKRDRHSTRHGKKQEDWRKHSEPTVAPAEKDHDWRKLMEEGKSERKGFRRKLKEMFKRG
jgi:hypothetical protein